MASVSGPQVLRKQSAGLPIQTVKVAVAGTGSFGARHFQALSAMQGVEPIAVPKRSSRLLQLQDQGWKTAATLEAAARAGASYCVVASETKDHITDTLQALELGMHVLVEKPLAADANEAQALFEALKRWPRRVYVGCVLRFSESLCVFRDWLPSIGAPHAVRIECQSYLPDWRPQRSYQETYSASASQGGVLRDLIHEIDYAGWLYGWPESVFAHVRNLGRLGIGSEEAAELSWQYSNGCVVSIAVDYLTRPPRRTMRALGSLGSLEWDGIHHSVTRQLAGKAPETKRCEETAEGRLSAELRAFLPAGEDQVMRLASWQEGLRALTVCDAARRAAQSQSVQRVDYGAPQ